MKSELGKERLSPWAFSLWAAILVGMGALTFGTPDQGDGGGCGGEHYDEDLGVLVVENDNENQDSLLGTVPRVPLIPELGPAAPKPAPKPPSNRCTIDVPINLCCGEEGTPEPSPPKVSPKCTEGEGGVAQWFDDAGRWFKRVGHELEAVADGAKKHCEEDEGWMGNTYRLVEILDGRRPLLSGRLGQNGEVGYSITCEVKGWNWDTGCDEIWVHCELVW